MADANFDQADIKRRLYNWEEGKCVSEDGVMGFRDDVHRDLRKHLAVTDSKSFYDALRRDDRGKGNTSGHRCRCEIMQSLEVANCSVRWCPHKVMMADPLTKRLHKAHLQPRLQAMESGHNPPK